MTIDRSRKAPSPLEASFSPDGDAAAERSELDALRDFFDNAAIGMHWVAADGTILRANRAELSMLGYEPDEYIGHHIAEFHVDRHVIEDMLSRLNAGEMLHNREARMRASDGSVKDVLIDSSARFEQGEFVHTRCVTREISAQQQAQHALHEREQRYQALVSALPALLVTTTPTGEIEEISRSYEEYTGLTLGQAKRWDEYNVIHPDDRERATAVWAEALASGDPLQSEMRLRRHDGVYRWYLMQGVPVHDDDGVIERWVTVNIDIDDRKRGEARERFLAETTAKLLSPLDSGEVLSELARLAVPTLADVCAIGIFEGGPATARLETAGLDEHERPYVERLHLRRWLTSPGSERRIDDAMKAGDVVLVPHFSREWIEACAPDEEQRDAAIAIGGRSIICVPIVARGETFGMATFATTRSRRTYDEYDVELIGEVAARVSIAVDNRRLFQELKATAEDLRRANAAKDEFLGLVSHELKTPITTIYGNAEVLRMRAALLDPQQASDALDDIRTESERLHRIIDNLLVLARLERGQQFEMVEPILLRRAIDRVVVEHRAHFPRRTIRVQTDIGLTPVLAEPLYLEQVLRNLLSNAEKYGAADQPIEVRLSRDGDDLCVSVFDRGEGFPPEEAERLFDPFYRSPRTSSKAQGIGIGLAVCKRLIEAQGGRMWARPREGGGSEFGFSLPVDLEDIGDAEASGAGGA